MNKLKTIFTVLLFYILSTNNLFSQSVGDYQSAANGIWNSAATWEVWNGSAWVPAGSPPTGSETITVDDTVVVDNAVNITGYVINTGIGNVEIGTGSMTFGNGSTYEHARNSGGIPPSTWGTGSTALFTGVTFQAPANRNQSFYNIVWDCTGQLSNLNMGFDEVTIGGDINIINTGANNRWYLCGPTGGDSVEVTINGNIIQTGGQFSAQGTGNGLTEVIVNVLGDITVTNGNLSVARGSQGGTGSTLWYLYGDNFSMTDAVTQNSNADGAKFIFAGTTPQNLTLTNVEFAGGFPVEVASNAILFAGESEIEGSGNFILNDNATLGCGNEGGIDSTLQMNGTITLSNTASFTFNGTVPQVTGSMLPSSVNDLTVNNGTGVTLTQNLVVANNLTILNGDLHLDGHVIDLGTTGTLSETAGNTVTDFSGSILAVRELNAPSGVNIGGLGAVFTSVDNLGTALVERIHSPGMGNGNQGIFRQYLISFLISEDEQEKLLQKSNESNLATSLQFYYDESELNGIPENNLTLFNSQDGTNNSWTPVGGTVNTSNNYVEVVNVTEVQWYWTIADINNPIPVELVSFTANVNEKVIVLNWTTATELNNSGWNIERKQIEQDWERIGFIEGSGNSTTNKNYSFIDKDVSSGKYPYRLQQIDYDGSTNYSNVIEIEINLLPEVFALYQNYPNPFNPSTTIKFDVPVSSFVNLSVYNSIGEKVGTLVNEKVEAGSHSIRFDASYFPSGIYFYRFSTDNQVFTNKMILIK